jgi:hypothetical protein
MHPLIGKLDGLSLEEILQKISDLHSKLTQTNKMGNYHLSNQIRAALSTYQEEYQKRMSEENEKAKNNKYLKDKVRVEKK